ncbi:hypothetical protein AA0119_g12795 [Alternaria tenuissima]|uniref:Uncharacterized protein n=2 Tax=Alternaria alternata complex TaxID=187734 RepID=A0A4Q4MYU1_ALTAL|nr:hypothetical protein AA0115_g12707 [Alternaria tenuissima]RYN63442.1 hypothetical protein AA0117_g12780 [Alternaria alternata]RYN26122.1 hypothetical protein AA0114_g12639 [Alternaria tenuissima]RYN86537.1 hypothetical protein AA0119_g12795 [Alternaria tenuissima]RYO03922.1 hypothetical protein AA0121_g12985 [Alternaria tenuissima]
MALSIIRKRIAYYGAGDLIAALPAHDLMDWVPHPAATPPKALVIGTYDGRDILAFMKSFGGSPPRVQYCFKPANRRLNASTAQPLTLDKVVKLPLNAPFRYSADTSEPGKSNFGIVIQWYFMGKIEPEIDYVKYCPRLYNALEKIDAEKRAEKESGKPEPEEPRGAQDQRPSHRSHTGIEARIARQLVTPVKSPVKSPLVSMSDDEHSDLNKLHSYLDSYDALYLLKNLPDADEVQFVNQDFFLDAQPRKLFMGRHKEQGNDIYAYMRKLRKFHKIEFYIEDKRAPSKTAIRSEDVAKQRILHPFDKTFPKGTHSIGQDEKARLTLMVKWYFIAAGIAKGCVLRETKAYPERLRSALEYIAKRMGAASVRTPLVGYERQTEPETTSEEASPIIDESHIQFTLAEVTPNPLSSPITSRTTPPRPSTAHAEQLNNPSNAVDAPELRGTKRTAEDAEFEDLTKIVSRVLTADQNLTNQINDIDKQIEQLQTQRRDLVEERKDAKRRFIRQTLAIASRTDG